MRFSNVALVLALSSSMATAAPMVEKRWFPGNWFESSQNGDAIIDFIKRFPWPGSGPMPGPPFPPAAGPQQAAGQCDLSNVQMSTAPKPLPPVDDGLHLYHVAIGRGTQNFTCDAGNATAVPVAIGAVATLFNATCLAATDINLLNSMPAIAVDLAVPSASNNPTGNPVYTDISGHHYFIPQGTPYFNLDTANADFGQGGFKVLNKSPAPADASVGQYGIGYGATTWLKLTAKDPSGFVVQEVYRLNTAGGNPPPSCANQPAAFEVQYSAQYWFYSR